MRSARPSQCAAFQRWVPRQRTDMEVDVDGQEFLRELKIDRHLSNSASNLSKYTVCECHFMLLTESRSHARVITEFQQ